MVNADKHLVLDASVIIDMWLLREPGEANLMADILQTAPEKGVRLWVAAAMLPTLEYVSVRRLKVAQVSGEMARKTIFNLIEQLLTRVEVLSCFGHEQKALYAVARDFEDAQIAASARCLQGGQVAIVSLDATFDARNEFEVLSPSAALAWMQDSSAENSRPIHFIDLAAQQRQLRTQIEQNIHRVLQHGKYIMGPEIAELEEKLAAYVGVKHCISAASGTDSLEIALRALDIGPGDEVITVPFTWISTAEVIAQVGAKPVFVDIDPATYNMNPELLAAAITPKTKAIMPVSLFGQMAEYEKINAIAAAHGNIPVIEDGAQSFGATRHNRRSCSVTTIASTSFFPAKPFGGYGDGGALFTDDDHLAAKTRAIRTHGGQQRHHHPYVGMNGRLDTMQAAILLAKWPSFQWEVEQRNAIGARYSELLANALAASQSADTIVAPTVAPGNSHVYAQYTLRCQDREAVAAKLKAQGIPSAIYYPKCLHEQPAFAHCGYQWGDFPEAEKASRQVLSLPMHPYLNQDEQYRIVQNIDGRGIAY